jgi:hypothetical protein
MSFDPDLSSTEAKKAGLYLAREIYASRASEKIWSRVTLGFRELQKDFGVTHLYDVPDFRGHEFFARVLKLARELGLRN